MTAIMAVYMLFCLRYTIGFRYTVGFCFTDRNGVDYQIKCFLI